MGLQRLLVETWSSREILVRVQGKKKDGSCRENLFCLRGYICHHEPGNANVKGASDEVSVGNEEDVIRKWS